MDVSIAWGARREPFCEAQRNADQPVEQFKVGLCRSVFMGLSRVFPRLGACFALFWVMTVLK